MSHRPSTWGPREVIALVVIVLSFTLAALGAVYGWGGETIPAWVAALVGGVALYLWKPNGGAGE